MRKFRERPGSPNRRHGPQSPDGWWRRDLRGDPAGPAHKERLLVGRISSTENPERGEKVVDQSGGSHGHPVEDGGFERAVCIKEIKEEVKKQKLEDERDGGHKIILSGVFPRGRPGMKRPSRIQQIIDSTDDDPGKKGGGGGHPMGSRIQLEKAISQREKKPDHEGIQEGAGSAHDTKTDDSRDLLFGHGRKGIGRVGPIRHKRQNGEKRVHRQTNGWGDLD
jgi:hypothetical protein